MGDASYKNIDFERMLSDLGQALERNKAAAAPGTMPATTGGGVGQPSDDALNRIDQRRVQMGLKPLGAIGAPGGADPRTMGMLDPQAAPMSPQDAQTSAQLDQVQTTGPGGVPFGSSPAPGAAAPPMSPADQATLAQLNQIQTTGAGGVPFGSLPGPMPHPAHAPPPAVAAQLAGIAQQPTAASAPPTVYPNINPQDPNAGLAAYSALNR
jgi:hypothetical protein